MYNFMCITGVNFISVSTILRLDFGTVQTVQYFLFSIFWLFIIDHDQNKYYICTS